MGEGCMIMSSEVDGNVMLAMYLKYRYIAIAI